MQRFMWVCLSGAVGTALRYLVGLYFSERFGALFPFGTLLVNLSGCFLMALVAHMALRVTGFPSDLRFALTAGFMGGLTTYSSFNQEATRMLLEGSAIRGLMYFGLTTVGCFVAGILGLALARALFGE